MSPDRIIAQSLSILSSNGYTVRADGFTAPGSPAGAIAEDPFGVVGLAVYDTFETLSLYWREAQAQLIALLRRTLEPADPKLKDSYLVLISATPFYDYEQLRQIREDTMLLRKYVIAGQHVDSSGDLQVALAPLLPVETEFDSLSAAGVLEGLPRLLERYNVPRSRADAVIGAFLRSEPLMDVIDAGGPNEA